MTPTDLATIQQALVALLTACLTVLAPLIAVRLGGWLDALAKDKQLSGAADLAHAVVRGVEQGFQGAAGPAKKDAAVAALCQALPWLPAGTAGVLIEAAVKAMGDLAERWPPRGDPAVPAPVVAPPPPTFAGVPLVAPTPPGPEVPAVVAAGPV